MDIYLYWFLIIFFSLLGAVILVAGCLLVYDMSKIQIYSNGCDKCLDPDGLSCFPSYGLAPHYHDQSNTHFIPYRNYHNFEPDPEDDTKGVYYCPVKGCPMSKELANK